MRQTWLIEPAFAEQHLPLINAYLSGQLANDKALANAKPENPAGFILSSQTKISASGRTRIPIFGRMAAADGQERSLVRHELEGDEAIPDNSVFVLDIRGAIFKEGSCCAYGTEDYARLINAAYDNDKIVGVVCLIDSPGGQLSGTPTLFDAIRDPRKPTVSVVNEGLMASAAYWLACGSDIIYATQKSDQIGSIGVFVQYIDRTEMNAKAGIKTVTVYSDRSSEKNKPFRDAQAGDTTLLVDDLNYAADLFREAVEQGRGDRLKPATKTTDVFKGAVFYAPKAIELGLIDGFGDLNTAVAKVYELAEARKSTTAETLLGSAVTLDSSTHQQASAPPAITGDILPPAPAGEANDSQPNQPQNDMFGDKHKALTALAGVEASAITDEQLTAVNANLDALNITGARIISTAYAQEAEASVGALTTANTQITTLTQERDDLRIEVTRLGAQHGHLGTKVEKVEEATAGEETTYISETDAEVARLRGAA